MKPAATPKITNYSYTAKNIWVLLCTLISVLMFSISAQAAKRVALVIGNSAYANATELENPANDAADMAAALSDLGFIVVKGIDLDNRGMREKVREFSNSLRGADTAMLYYAGHAMQVNGQNYLAPVDTKLEFESDLDFETIPLKFIQSQMEREAKTTLLFLDACRDNPLTRSFKASTRSQGAGRGLAKEDLASSGILIAFATNPENVALDGTGRNSPFTRAMLDNIRRPGVEISSLMTDVRVQVVKDTGGQQTPWINSALLGRFYFNPDEGAPKSTESAALTTTTEVQQATNVQPIARSNAGVSNAQIAALAYDAIKDTNNVAELEVFVSLYGNSFYGQLAKLRIDKLNKVKNEDAAVPTKMPESTATDGGTEVALLTPEKAKAPKPEPEVDVAAPMDLYKVKFGIQEELARLNCGPGRPDGLWGKRSQAALNKFSKRLKLVASTPTESLYKQLRRYKGRGCYVKPASKSRSVKTCPAGQKLSSKGTCYRPKTKTVKTCPAGQKPSSKGNCYTPKKKVAKKCAAGQKLSRKGNCYTPKAKTAKACPSGQRRSSKGHCYTPVQKQAQCGPGERRSSKGHCYTPHVVVERERVQEREVVRERKPSVGGRIIRGVVGGVVCGVSGICKK